MKTDRPPTDTNGNWPFDRIVVASPEELLFAEELRVRIREQLLGKSAPMPLPWCVSVE